VKVWELMDALMGEDPNAEITCQRAREMVEIATPVGEPGKIISPTGNLYGDLRTVEIKTKRFRRVMGIWTL
jgi:hypothetical protein